MSFIAEKLQELKSAAHRALEFADPEAALRKAEDNFKEAMVDAYHDLVDRIEVLERNVTKMITPVDVPMGAVDVPMAAREDSTAPAADAAPAPQPVTEAAPPIEQPAA